MLTPEETATLREACRDWAWPQKDGRQCRHMVTIKVHPMYYLERGHELADWWDSLPESEANKILGNVPLGGKGK
jgi:hypothetical protein